MNLTRESRDTYLQAVRIAKERVSRLSPDQLRNLFDDAPIQAAVSDLPVEVSIIRERHESSGGILIVAQAFRPWTRLVAARREHVCGRFHFAARRPSNGARAKRFMGLHLRRSDTKRSNQTLQPTALWRCASISILISVSSTGAQPRSPSGG